MDKLLRPLASEERTALAGTENSYARAKGRLGYVELGGNPLDPAQLVLHESDGTWPVTELQ
ncbi:hypothetical protein R1T08_14630 [Streptomyces sp. SBC-4]|nr:hypothetical protein [Streptomyces sp. SBC-4]MDV5145413.1 hypothetical protein [Streptomyces sp. SBC-4]